MIERSRRVVLLIDYDNLQICASRDTPGRDLQLPPVVQLAQHYGTVILARAYAEWNLSTERLAVYKAGIEPAFAPVLRTESDRSGKSLADTVMVAEGMDMLWTLSPDVVVLATSDKDLIPLVRVAKQRGAFVVVLGSDFTAIPLREMADEHVTYKQLITDSQGRYVTEAGPARQPAALPEPVRRRSTRERNGRERTPVTPPVATPAPAAPPPARTEREVQPTPAAVQSLLPTTAAAEPVAPLSVGVSGEGDAQGVGRRRRRRGSRRRSERVGGLGEGPNSAEGGPDAEDSFTEGFFTEGEPVEGGFAEVLEAGEPEDDQELDRASTFEAAPITIADEPDLASMTAEAAATVPAGPDAGVPIAAPAAPRNRRRSARRPPVVTTADAATGDIAGVADEAASAPALGSSSQLPDILWAADPAQANGFPAATGDPQPDSASGEPLAEDAAAAPRPRSRRIRRS